MKFKKFGTIALSAIFATSLLSCGSGDKKEADSTEEEFTKAEQEQLIEKVEEVVYNIPSPSEIPFLLESTGAEFNNAFVSDINKSSSYETTNDKAALNLGIYTTDIGYFASYEKAQDALNYLNSSRNLVDYLGLTNAFDLDFIKRFEGNLDNKDSLAYVLNEAVQRTDKFLKEDNRTHHAAYIISGSFIEGLFISTQLIKTYPKDVLPEDARNLVLTQLIRVILEQEKALTDLIKLLESLDKNDITTNLLSQLNELNGLYSELNIAEQIENNNGNLVLTDETLIGITEKVEIIRNSITE